LLAIEFSALATMFFLLARQGFSVASKLSASGGWLAIFNTGVQTARWPSVPLARTSMVNQIGHAVCPHLAPIYCYFNKLCARSLLLRSLNCLGYVGEREISLAARIEINNRHLAQNL
jgi:hypothetical protein